jgi:hypothetical protein
MSSDSAGALFFGIFILAVIGDALGGGRQAPPRTVNPVPVADSAQQAAAWDERSDCHPGATPNSLANAIDVMQAHCDRAKAIARLAPLAVAVALPLLGEAAIGEAAVVSQAGRGMAAAGELRAAGAAADAAALSETAAAEEATLAQGTRTYRAPQPGGTASRPNPPIRPQTMRAPIRSSVVAAGATT